ncbi:MAG: isopentenyl-diphosphate delta-isomerase [Chitinophagaceae bacterium]
MKETEVILVNEQDEALGVMEKMEVHQQGFLHRAFSIFIFNKEGRMLLQQRAAGKYHGAHLWTNACCSHPYPDEEVIGAAQRRLQEELGFTTSLDEIFSFTYKAEVENNLIEHEYDHVFTGFYDGVIIPNPSEVEAYKYEEMTTLVQDIKNEPQKFTSWFKIAFPRVEHWWRSEFVNLKNI